VSLESAEVTETAAETATEAPTQTPTSGHALDTTARATEAVAGSTGLSRRRLLPRGLLVVALLVGWWGYRTYGR